MKLEAEKISRQYFRKGRGTNVFTAVKETDLVLEPGKMIEIEGRSGSGKSTLLNMMAGLLTPTAGKVFLDGKSIYDLPDAELSRLRNRHIGVIPQGQTALKALTVLENVLLPSEMYGGNTDPERARNLLQWVGIGHLADVYPEECSGGELRRLAIARAFMQDPEILLADEPTADLDDENTRNILSILKQQAEAGKAVLLVTHEAEAAAWADQVYRMNDGVLEK